jgi:CRISPR system Cascade subunit CasD
MSTEIAWLGLRFEGPLQAWGYASQFNRRNTGMFPTKSAVLGMVCAAMGIHRGSKQEQDMLAQLRSLQLLSVTVPRLQYQGMEYETTLPIRRLTDYHTVQNTLTADGKLKDTHLTWRQYLCDASFIALLSGNRSLLIKVGAALRNPVWGVWLGRKACIPTAPVLVRKLNNQPEKGGDYIYDSEEDALRTALDGNPLSAFTYQREVTRFEDGTDTFMDQPLCYGGVSASRSFSPRRIKLIEGRR